MNGSQKAACLLSVAALFGAACSETAPNPAGTGGATLVTGGTTPVTGGTTPVTGGTIPVTGGMTTMTGGMTTGTGGTGATGGVVIPTQPCAERGLVDPTGSCAPQANGIYAIKTVLDVWWDPPGGDTPSSLVNPGRGKIEIYMLAEIDNVCKDPATEGATGAGIIRSCGSRMPAFTSEATCGVIEIAIPDDSWDAASMPSFSTSTTSSGFEPGDVITLGATTGLVGIDMSEPDGTFPGPHGIVDVACAAGTGGDCFPDHDDNMAPGIQATIRTDGDPAPLDQYPAECGFSDIADGPYFFRGAPGDGLPDMLGGMVTDPARLVGKVDIGLRLRVGGGGGIDGECRGGAGIAEATTLDTIVVGCTLVNGQPCSAAQATFVAEQTPQYRILQPDEKPAFKAIGLAWPPFSTKDQSPSVGAQGAMIRLGDIGAAVDCEMVRTAGYAAYGL